MSIPNLPVDFKDDILSSTNKKRKYTEINNLDGTKSFEDSTEYDQVGSDFGASQVNKTNQAVNNIYSERILDIDELELVTEPGFFVDAMAVKEAYTELNSKIEIIDGWTVIKHANGKCECWRRFSWNTYLGTLWKNGMYFATSDLDGGFPVTFIDTPVVEITPNTTNALYWMAATGITTTSMRLTCYSMTQETLNTISGIYVVGRWK